MAEELAFEEVLGDGDVISLAADTEAVEGAGDQFLAGAAFAEDQDGGVGGGDVLDEFAQLQDLGRFADDLIQAVNLASILLCSFSVYCDFKNLL